VYTHLLAIIPALIFALIYKNWLAGLLFWVGSVSHWLLDAIVHLHDLPVLGFGRDRKIGLGLWKHPLTAFTFEYLLFAACVLASIDSEKVIPMLVAGAALHLFNSNAFFGYMTKGLANTPKAMAALALSGFSIAIGVFALILS
jgi:hypothetical protein